jgi:bifunctional NMN adenylyltransferase/nudix hydrolase
MAIADVGVIVGRFQVQDLHTGHSEIIDEVFKNHKKVLIFIGVSSVKNTRRNPLDYITRVKMISNSYPDAVILQINDQPDDKIWSEILDARIREICQTESILLYGSRDGFIPRYSGKFSTVELQSSKSLSGSEIRELASKEVINSKEFRHGVIYASYNKYPISYPTVDAAVVDIEKCLLLLAKKKNESLYRFIGGFVDITKDDTLENAIKREVSEETNALGVGKPEYICSSKIDDWRYRSNIDGIMTTFFYVPYVFGNPKACDDINELKWMHLSHLYKQFGIVENIVKEHQGLANKLKEYLLGKDAKLKEYCNEK